MNVKYKFTSMQSLADYFANKALEAKTKRNDYSEKSHWYIKCTEVAVTYENVADMIRNTEIIVDGPS